MLSDVVCSVSVDCHRREGGNTIALKLLGDDRDMGWMSICLFEDSEMNERGFKHFREKPADLMGARRNMTVRCLCYRKAC